MTSTRTKNLARAIQRANPGMKYTEALRYAEHGQVVFDPKAPNPEDSARLVLDSDEAFANLQRAAGIDATALSIRFPLRPSTEVREDAKAARDTPERPLDPHDNRLFFDPNGDFVSTREVTSEPRINYVDKDRPVHDLHPSVWDGEVHPDPLTFLIGHDLRTKKARYVSLNGSTPHMMIAGGTATGKSSTAEIITMQALTKSMPWDADLFSTVMVMDPLGVAAPRWAGRRGVIAVNGANTAGEPDQNGDFVPGEQVMATALEWVTEEWARRASILSRHDARSWIELSDEVKREERFAPLFVVVDEYRDPNGHKDATWEAARRHVLNLVRKGRAFGMHLIVTSQDLVNRTFGLSTDSGSGMLPVLTGQASEDQLNAFFGFRDVPAIPTTRESIKDEGRSVETVPGRARIPDAEGNEIDLIQVLRLGRGWKALDKWLPRGEVPPNGDFTPASGGRNKQG